MRVRRDESSGLVLLVGKRVDWVVVTVLVLIEDVGVSVREGSSLNILSTDANVIALVNKRCKSKCFSSTPVDTLALFERVIALFEDFLDCSVELFVFR